MGVMYYLPLPLALAAAGAHVLCACSRYPNNDSALIMEKVLVDLGKWVSVMRAKHGYEKIILGGWSGGGSLSLFYQAEAEKSTRLTQTPAGDPIDLSGLQKCDGIMLLAAHMSRASTLTEWLDPSIVDENNPDARDSNWDIYANPAPATPPYNRDWLVEFHEKQIARNRKITAWAQDKLNEIKSLHGSNAERTFVVHGTMADPRWLDATIDPNDRKPGWCYLGDPKLINNAPGGLGRVATLRSWLSQWSYDLSNADGISCAQLISVPALVIGNSADDACTPSHTRRLFEAIGHPHKECHTITGATHYYAGQAQQLQEATTLIMNWLRNNILSN
jgi:pimeloyl-ACP methyl ester carboxylesterase